MDTHCLENPRPLPFNSTHVWVMVLLCFHNTNIYMSNWANLEAQIIIQEDFSEQKFGFWFQMPLSGAVVEQLSLSIKTRKMTLPNRYYIEHIYIYIHVYIVVRNSCSNFSSVTSWISTIPTPDSQRPAGFPGQAAPNARCHDPYSSMPSLRMTFFFDRCCYVPPKKNIKKNRPKQNHHSSTPRKTGNQIRFRSSIIIPSGVHCWFLLR